MALLAGIPEPASRAFAFTTRLAAGEVAGLGMSSWQGRYLPLLARPAPPASGRQDRRRLNGQAILAPATRYCPGCLAGDGSAIQQSLGGPWLKAWHLPVVFACPAHGQLLEHLCPGCGQAVRGRRPGTEYSLLPAPRVAGLHPAQCRTELTPARGHGLPGCCQARLDAPGGHREASPGLITVQGKILDLLRPGGPGHTLSAGQPASPPGYFADLRVIANLTCSTWPAARDLSPAGPIADAIDEHVAALRRQGAGRQQDNCPSPSGRVTPGALPADAAASAGLAFIADRVLEGSTGEVREKLRPLLPARTARTERKAWASRIARSSPPCSSGLHEASAPLLQRFTGAGGRPGRTRMAAFPSQRWGPEHIPAIIPEDWYTRHLTPVSGISPMLVRRTAAVRLVQMTAGGSLAEAAAFLGITTAPSACPGARQVHAAARQQPDPHRFDDELARLARELSDPATPLVNYQRRRQAMGDWQLDEDTWAALASRLPAAPSARPDLGNRKRQAASIYTWVQVTSGQHNSAPRPIEAAQPPEIQRQWNDRLPATWFLMNRERPGPHYASLKAELSTIATSLARTIDAADPPR
jgi:hypothetical protein